MCLRLLRPFLDCQRVPWCEYIDGACQDALGALSIPLPKEQQFYTCLDLKEKLWMLTVDSSYQFDQHHQVPIVSKVF